MGRLGLASPFLRRAVYCVTGVTSIRGKESAPKKMKKVSCPHIFLLSLITDEVFLFQIVKIFLTTCVVGGVMFVGVRTSTMTNRSPLPFSLSRGIPLKTVRVLGTFF